MKKTINYNRCGEMSTTFFSYDTFDTKEEAKAAELDVLKQYPDSYCYFSSDDERITHCSGRTIHTSITCVIDFGDDEE